MSRESAKEFMEKVKSSEEIEAQIPMMSTPEAVCGYAREHGYAFTVDEFKQVVSEEKSTLPEGDGILSEEDTNAIVGGIHHGSPCGSQPNVLNSMGKPAYYYA